MDAAVTLLLPPARYTCPFVEKFSIEIETYYLPDGGQQPNVFNLSGAERRQRILGEAFWGSLGGRFSLSLISLSKDFLLILGVAG